MLITAMGILQFVSLKVEKHGQTRYDLVGQLELQNGTFLIEVGTAFDSSLTFSTVIRQKCLLRSCKETGRMTACRK